MFVIWCLRFGIFQDRIFEDYLFRCTLLKMVGQLILTIIRGERVISNIGPEDEIREGDTIVVIGKRESRDKLEELEFS